MAGAVPGDVRDDVARPAGTAAFVDQFRHGSIAAFGPDRCRLVVEEGPTVFHREAGEPFGMLLPALGQGGIEVVRRDRPGAQSLSKPFRCWQNVTGTNIGKQLASDQKRPVGKAKKRVDRHVVSQWPEWRNDGPNGGEMRRQCRGSQSVLGGFAARRNFGHQRRATLQDTDYEMAAGWP